MSSSSRRVAVVTGGSAGLGIPIARTLHEAGYQIILVGRTQATLAEVADRLQQTAGPAVVYEVADVTDPQQVDSMFGRIADRFGRLDVLINCVGKSDRGLVEDLDGESLKQLFDQNVLSTLNCCQAAIELLSVSRGVIVNIGSLASKVSPRFLGGYAIVKHGLAALTGQLRLELQPRGIHVALISPGPIRREDAGDRYNQVVDQNLPDQAKQPGAGTRVKGLPPQKVAAAVLRTIRQRTPDTVLPGYLRPLIAAGHLMPRLGDWLLMKFTSTKR